MAKEFPTITPTNKSFPADIHQLHADITMIEWTLMYRILGIPLQINEPTSYHLLGIDPRHCTTQVIEQALNKQRKVLRQNIPGPHFIPLVAKFENEILLPAAQILSDPEKRLVYNQSLRQTIYNPQLTAQAKIRANQIRQAKDLIVSNLDENNILPQKCRTRLSQQLSDLGFNQGDIQLVMERIPAEAPKPQAQSSPKEIDYSINQDFTIQIDNILKEFLEQTNLKKQRNHYGFWWITITAIIIAFTVFFVLPSSQKTAENIPPAISHPDIPQNEPESDPSILKDQSPLTNQPSHPKLSSTPNTRTDQLAQIFQHLSHSNWSEELLADSALITFAISEQMRQFTGQMPFYSPDIESLLGTENLVQGLLLKVPESVIANISYSVPNHINPKTLQYFQEKLQSTTAGIRVWAIEKLRSLNHPAATAILLKSLSQTPLPGQSAMSRILHALQTIHDQTILPKLVEILSRTNNDFLARQISYTLTIATHQSDPIPPQAILPLHFTRFQKQNTVQWWANVLDTNQLTWYPRKMIQPDRWEEKETPAHPVIPVWQPDIKSLQLVAVMIYDLQNINQQLKQAHWNTSGQLILSPSPMSIKNASPNPFDSRKWLVQLEAINHQLVYLIRQSPLSPNPIAPLMTDILARNKTHLLLSETFLQKVTVHLATTSNLLNHLIALHQPDENRKQILQTMNQYWRKQLQLCPTVLRQVRTLSYYNLLLWNQLHLINPNR